MMVRATTTEQRHPGGYFRRECHHLSTSINHDFNSKVSFKGTGVICGLVQVNIRDKL